MNPYRSYTSPPSPLLPPNPLPPGELDIVKIVKSREYERIESIEELAYFGQHFLRYVGKKGFISMISNEGSEPVYGVTFVEKGRKTSYGFFFDDEIEVVERNRRR